MHAPKRLSPRPTTRRPALIIGQVLAAGIAATVGLGLAATAQATPIVPAAPDVQATATSSEIVARSSCTITGHTFSIDEHETPADSHGRHTADIDFYVPGSGTVTLAVTDRGGVYHQKFSTTISPIGSGWHHLTRFYRKSVGTPVSYRFSWNPTFVSGTGSCGSSYCGPGSFTVGPNQALADRAAGIVGPMGGC